jgi:hypothetical protein
MSRNARWLDRSEPNKDRRARAKPKAQLVATIRVWERGPETDYEIVASCFQVTRTRLRSERFVKTNENKPPGEDGCRWDCTCDRKGMREDHAGTPGKRFDCKHLRAVLTGDRIAEGDLPAGRKPKDNYNDPLLDVLYVKLTVLGEGLVRHRWAEYALRRTSES